MPVQFTTLGQGAVRTTNILAGTQPISMCGVFYVPTIPPATVVNTIWYRGDDPVTLYTDYVWIGVNTDGWLQLSTSGAADVSFPGPIAPGWHTWAYSYSHVSGTHTLYMDGGFDSVSVVDSTAAWAITHEYLGTDEFLPDDWDENWQWRVKQWNEILAAGEMWATTNYDENPGIRVANIHGDWPLIGDLLDVSGLGYDWTAVNGPLDFTAAPNASNRWYPLVRAPRVRIDEPVKGTWVGDSFSSTSWGNVQWTWMAGMTPYLGGVAQTQGPSTTFQFNATADYDWHFMRWMIGPLEAMELDTLFNLCFYGRCAFESGGSAATSDVRYKLHIYITVGETAEVRTVVLDNYVDATAFFPSTGLQRWQTLTTPQALAGTVEAGDCLMIEFGWSVVSSPPTTPVTYPPTEYTEIVARPAGANPANVDATPLETTSSRNAWFQFSQFLFPQAESAPPANDDCADAIAITLDVGTRWEQAPIDTSGSLGTNRAVFFTWTAPADGRVYFTSFGSTYAVAIVVYTNGCTQTSQPSGFANFNQRLGTQRSMGIYTFEAASGQAYLIRATSSTAINTSALNGGGLLMMQGFYQQTLAVDDVIMPDNTITVFREGLPTSISLTAASFTPSGVAFDYTHRPLVPIGAGTNPNVSDRLIVSLFPFEGLVEIFDPYVFGSGDEELDYIGAPFVNSDHAAQSFVTLADGILTQAWFGNGFLFVAGVGNLPATLNAPSDDPAIQAFRTISAVDGDNQPGAPFPPASENIPSVEATAAWCLTMDEVNQIIYYTSGLLYDQVAGGPAQQIRRYDLAGSTDLGVWATLPTRTLLSPLAPVSVRGLEYIGNGQVLVCNSDVVHLLDENAVIVRTYTPSIPEDSQALVDVKLTADGSAFWTQDLWSTRLYKFDLATGTELLTTQNYQIPASQIQMAIFQPDGFVPPTPECPGIVTGPLQDGLPYVPVPVSEP